MTIDASLFLEHFKEALEMEENQELNLSDRFRELDDWDSLARLSLIAMMDQEYELEIESERFDQMHTVQELYDWLTEQKA